MWNFIKYDGSRNILQKIIECKEMQERYESKKDLVDKYELQIKLKGWPIKTEERFIYPIQSYYRIRYIVSIWDSDMSCIARGVSYESMIEAKYEAFVKAGLIKE
jgi:hypothetical protein